MGDGVEREQNGKQLDFKSSEIKRQDYKQFFQKVDKSSVAQQQKAEAEQHEKFLRDKKKELRRAIDEQKRNESRLRRQQARAKFLQVLKKTWFLILLLVLIVAGAIYAIFNYDKIQELIHPKSPQEQYWSATEESGDYVFEFRNYLADHYFELDPNSYDQVCVDIEKQIQAEANLTKKVVYITEYANFLLREREDFEKAQAWLDTIKYDQLNDRQKVTLNAAYAELYRLSGNEAKADEYILKNNAIVDALRSNNEK